jgi:hypothetical protein
MTITRADVKGWTMRETAHYNGGKEWFGYGHQCIENPRLYRLDRYTRKDRSVTSTWSVDGEDCADLDEAIERLNSDPVVTADEIAALKLLTTEFQPLRDVRAGDAYKALPQGTLSHWCSRKGLVWAEKGQARLTELGARILRDSGSDPKGEDAPAAECGASQSGGSVASVSPNPSHLPPSSSPGEEE